MRTGNDICPKCLTAHPATMDCTLRLFQAQDILPTERDREAADAVLLGWPGLAWFRKPLEGILASHAATARAEALEEAAKVARQYADVPLGSAPGWSEVLQEGFEIGCADTSAAIEIAIRALVSDDGGIHG